MDKKGITRIVCAAGLMIASPWALAQAGHMHGAGPGAGGCAGMGGAPGAAGGPGMGGMGPGMGMGLGAGGGMMDGMMGPGGGMGMGMGPGMMGPGIDMGQGMMGYGAMGGAGPYAALNLSQDQQRRMNSIQDTLRKQHWDLQGKVYDEQAKLRDLYAQEQPDPKKVGEVYSNIANLQRQMVESRVQAQNQMQNVLTPEQKAQLSQLRRGAWGGGYGGGPGAGGPGVMRR